MQFLLLKILDLIVRTMKIFLAQISSINRHWYRYWCISTVPHTAPLSMHRCSTAYATVTDAYVPYHMWYRYLYICTVPHMVPLPIHRHSTTYGTAIDA